MKGGPVPIFDLPELDQPLAGALPAGWLGLVEGDVGGLSHLLAKQAAHAASASVPVFYYVTHEPAAEVARTFDGLGWEMGGLKIIDLEEEMYADLLHRDIAVARARAKGLSLSEAQLGSTVGPTGRSPPSLAGRLLSDIAPMDGPFRCILDSFDPFLEELGEGAVRLTRQIRHQAAAVGGSALILVRPEVPEPRTLAQLELIADFVVEAQLEEQETNLASRIVLRKVRNHPERTRIYRATVGEKGLEVVPL